MFFASLKICIDFHIKLKEARIRHPDFIQIKGASQVGHFNENHFSYFTFLYSNTEFKDFIRGISAILGHSK